MIGLTYHVAKNGSDQNQGSKDAPFLTINHAAQVALPGDTILVHEGEYREWVRPKNPGLSEHRRITYQAAEGEKVVIKGSERIDTWLPLEAGIWKVIIPNDFFGQYNPYTDLIKGDWLIYRSGICHTGEVYLNGMSFYEVESYDALLDAQTKEEVYDHWTKKMVKVKNVEQTKYLWFVEVDEEQTTIFANFHDANPNEELVEINVRRACFYPETTGVDYITVKGFEMCHAATPWTPPTADQTGLIGANWSKSWIIEDNCIHDAKCSGISIGKEALSGNNYRTFRRDKPGYQYQLESVYTAHRNGWAKEKIGSHIIRNNTIYDCGQNAIVGHLGCIFSEISGNHIYNIAIKREFYGHEIAGIKLHAAIDVYIYDNVIHDCSLGLWLDWQAQGARISHNLFYHNQRDFFIEVTHGPHLVDNNIFASEYAIDNHAQGTAYVRNIIAGKMEVKKIMDRSTPYHLPHSTALKGYAKVYSGDEQFYQNIFIGSYEDKVGTAMYSEYPESLEEFIALVNEEDYFGDHSTFEKVEQPVYLKENHYFLAAKASAKEKKTQMYDGFDPELKVEERKDGIYVKVELPDELFSSKGESYYLPRTRIVDQEFEYPNGEPVILYEGFYHEEALCSDSSCDVLDLIPGQNILKFFTFKS